MSGNTQLYPKAHSASHFLAKVLNYGYDLAWSPDGRYLAYAGSGFIYIIDADTGEMQFRYRADALMPDGFSLEGILLILVIFCLVMIVITGVAWTAVTAMIVAILFLLDRLHKRWTEHDNFRKNNHDVVR